MQFNKPDFKNFNKDQKRIQEELKESNDKIRKQNKPNNVFLNNDGSIPKEIERNGVIIIDEEIVDVKNREQLHKLK